MIPPSSSGSLLHTYRRPLSANQIHLPTILSLLNQALGSDGLIVPRISASPITQVRWTRQGPVLTLLLEDAYGEAHLAFRPITTREWVSLIQLTGVMSQYITLGYMFAGRPSAPVRGQ